MWVGSMRSPMRISAYEELGTMAENNPLLLLSLLGNLFVVRLAVVGLAVV